MNQIEHIIVGTILFHILFHTCFKKLPFIQQQIRIGEAYWRKKIFK